MNYLADNLSRVGKAIAPLLLTAVTAMQVSGEVPKEPVKSPPIAAAAKKAAASVQGLQEILSQREITALASGYAPVFSELDAAVWRLEPLMTKVSKGEPVDWKAVVDNFSTPTGDAANKIIAFQLMYDGTAALQQLGKLTGDPKWGKLAESVGKIYAAAYAVPGDGKVPAFKNYSTGLIALGDSTGNRDFIKAALLQESNAPYIAPNAISKEELKSPFLSRENALATMAMVNSHHATKQLDAPLFKFHVQRLDQHLKLWERALQNPGTEIADWPKTVNADYQGLSPDAHFEVQQTYVRPFMVALTTIAAVRALDVDPTTARPVLEQAGKTLRALRGMYSPGGTSFPYTDRKFPANHALTKLSEGLTTEPSPDLNGLIGGAYYRAGVALGDAELKAFGETLIRGGLKSMYTGGKQLNQFLLPFADTLLK